MLRLSLNSVDLAARSLAVTLWNTADVIGCSYFLIDTRVGWLCRVDCELWQLRSSNCYNRFYWHFVGLL